MGTRLTLTESVRRRIDEKEEDNSHFTDEEIYDYINQGIRFLGTDLEWPLQTAQATGVEDQAVYTLPDDFISLVDVYYDNRPLTIIERADLTSIRPTWQDAESGTPRYAYKSDNDKFGLYPKPNEDEAGLLLQIQYIKVPPDLDDDTTSPDLHVAFQDCLPFYAAFLCQHDLGNIKSAEVNYKMYETHVKKLQSKVQRFSDDTQRFRWMGPY